METNGTSRSIQFAAMCSSTSSNQNDYIELRHTSGTAVRIQLRNAGRHGTQDEIGTVLDLTSVATAVRGTLASTV